MNLPATLPTASRHEIVSRYQRLRTISRDLNQSMVERLATDVIHEGARKLGILKRGTLVFHSEDEMSVLMDYCLYDVRRKGRNVIEQYLADGQPALASDETACLRAMQQAIYSLFVVETVERGLGVTARDLLSNDTVLIVDMGFGSSAQPGLVFASRLLTFDEFSITGGAALPIAVVPTGRLDAVANELLVKAAPDGEGYFDPAPLIRACLSEGCSSHVQYQDPTEHAAGERQLPDRRPSARIGRNDPCPCGSGKKFKHCCIRRA